MRIWSVAGSVAKVELLGSSGGWGGYGIDDLLLPPEHITSTWDGSTGIWTDFTKWSSDPLYPDNGNGDASLRMR